MTIQSGQFTATTTAQIIATADADGCEIHIHNDAASGDLYLGGADLTAINGIHLDPKEQLDKIRLSPNSSIYAITSTGTVIGSWLSSEA
jgi:hypothetical protein